MSSTQRVALDLYAGTGSSTAAFRRRGWKVITVDIDPGRTADVIADVRRLPFAGKVDFIWSSPPCNEFSDAAPGRIERRPSLDHVVATLEAVRSLRPRFWIMENVRGAIPIIGIPVQKIGPWCLWGYFPYITASLEAVDHRKSQFRSAVAWATVPMCLSEAVCQAVERFWDAKSLLDMRPFRRHRHVARINAQ